METAAQAAVVMVAEAMAVATVAVAMAVAVGAESRAIQHLATDSVAAEVDVATAVAVVEGLASPRATHEAGWAGDLMGIRAVETAEDSSRGWVAAVAAVARAVG
jgi:hypothetical protein